MRERHNIVGSEVGRPRPPVYTLRILSLAKRRSSLRWAALGVAAGLIVILIIAAQFYGLGA